MKTKTNEKIQFVGAVCGGNHIFKNKKEAKEHLKKYCDPKSEWFGACIDCMNEVPFTYFKGD